VSQICKDSIIAYRKTIYLDSGSEWGDDNDAWVSVTSGGSAGFNIGTNALHLPTSMISKAIIVSRLFKFADDAKFVGRVGNDKELEIPGGAVAMGDKKWGPY